MSIESQSDNQIMSIEEKRLQLDEKKFLLESSFAKKWWPTLATFMAGLIAVGFDYLQNIQSKKDENLAKDLAKIAEDAKNEREFGIKVIDIYLRNSELFDFNRNPQQAQISLRVFSAVAPTAVKSVLDAELNKIQPPNISDNSKRLESLAAVAQVQNSLAIARPQAAESSFKPAEFTVYVQHPEDMIDTAKKMQNFLLNQGYRVPGIEQTLNPPSRLQVRYYRPNQKIFAVNLVTQLGQALSLRATDDNAILVTSPRELPSGILEVWLPPRQS